jgi:hypothetical protein
MAGRSPSPVATCSSRKAATVSAMRGSVLGAAR